MVIGGTSILGGSGGYSGTIIGALILTVLNSLLTLLSVTQAARQMLYGVIVLIAGLDLRPHRRRRVGSTDLTCRFGAPPILWGRGRPQGDAPTG